MTHIAIWIFGAVIWLAWVAAVVATIGALAGIAGAAFGWGWELAS